MAASFACVGPSRMSLQSVQMLLSLALGFAVAGLCTASYQLITDRLPSFSLLTKGPRPATFAALALLLLSAPFLIMRNTLLGGPSQGRFQFVFFATLVSGFWSLMSGMVLVMAWQAILLA